VSDDATARSLVWEGCYNVRDLGGHSTRAGQTTRFGAVVRSDNPVRLRPPGLAALRAYGIKTVVDLRDPSEIKEEGTISRDALDGDVVNVPVIDFSDRPFWEAWSGKYDPAGFYRDALRRWPDRFAAAIVAVARARPGGVLVHCQAGRDRTGLVCALMLSLVGVAPEAIAADYALSATRLRPLYDEWIGATDDPSERERLRRENLSEAAAMLDVLRTIDVESYLRAGGADENDLEAVRVRLSPAIA
jgi:protein-tyrosine phosphatase